MLHNHGLLFPPLDQPQEQGPNFSLSRTANLFSPLWPRLQHVLKVYLKTLPPHTLSEVLVIYQRLSVTRILQFFGLHTFVFLYVSVNSDHNVVNSKHICISYICEVNFCRSVCWSCHFTCVNALISNTHLNTDWAFRVLNSCNLCSLCLLSN